MKTNRLRSLSLGVALAACATGLMGIAAETSPTGAAQFGIQRRTQPTEWILTYAGKPLLVYASDPQKYKPYIKVLNTVKGYGVLRDSPGDHLHHHALMYGIRVNGLNFWEETASAGVQKVIETQVAEAAAGAGELPKGQITQLLYWVAPEDAFLPTTNTPALLIERRTITLSVDPGREETAVHWRSQFKVGTKTNVVTLSGANYHGLGMRFLQELDPVAVHFTPEGKPDLSGNRQDVSAHEWEAVSFDAPGRPATIVLFGDPRNARGKPQFFAMKTPFAYIAATQGLDKEPLVYRAGQEFELNYVVALYARILQPNEVRNPEAQAQSGAK